MKKYQLQWYHKYSLSIYTVCAWYVFPVWNPSSLTVSIFVIISVNEMNLADLQRTNARNVKKINDHINTTNTHWSCLLLVKACQLTVWNSPSLTVSVIAIMMVDDMNGADLQRTNAGNVKKLTIVLIS